MDEPIKLKPFAVDPYEYRKVFYSYGLLKSVVRIVVVFAIATILITFSWDRTAGAYLGFAGVVFILMILLARWNTLTGVIQNPKNASVFSSRQVEIAGGEYHVATGEGMRSIIPLRCFVNAVEYGPYILLFLTQNHIYVVPRSAFADTSEEMRFMGLLRANGVIR